MTNDEPLNRELFDWKQEKLEQGKFPCQCGHFESAHVKRMCIACHGEDGHTESSYEEDGLNFKVKSCFHEWIKMDNLTLIEWMAKHKTD